MDSRDIWNDNRAAWYGVRLVDVRPLAAISVWDSLRSGGQTATTSTQRKHTIGVTALQRKVSSTSAVTKGNRASSAKSGRRPSEPSGVRKGPRTSSSSDCARDCRRGMSSTAKAKFSMVTMVCVTIRKPSHRRNSRGAALGNDDDGEELMGSLTVSVPALYMVPAASRTISSSTPFSKAMEVKEGISAVYIDVKQL